MPPQTATTDQARQPDSDRAAADDNLVSLTGTVTTTPELRRFESGSSLARVLVTVRSENEKRRVDVLPISVWNPSQDVIESARGDRVAVRAQAQRRFWSGASGRMSRLELVALNMEITAKTDQG